MNQPELRAQGLLKSAISLLSEAIICTVYMLQPFLFRDKNHLDIALGDRLSVKKPCYPPRQVDLPSLTPARRCSNPTCTTFRRTHGKTHASQHTSHPKQTKSQHIDMQEGHMIEPQHQENTMKEVVACPSNAAENA